MHRPHLFLFATLLGLAGCGSASMTTTVLPPHRLERPICPDAVLVHDSPAEMPGGGRVIARIRLAGRVAGASYTKWRRRLQGEAARLGANRVLAAEVTTPGMLEMLALGTVAGAKRSERDKQFNDAATDPRLAARSTPPPPVDESYLGKGLAYAVFIAEDTLRTNLECQATLTEGP